MDPIVITWRELLIAVIAVLAVYAAELLLLLRFGRQPRLPFRTRSRPDPSSQPQQPYALGHLREEVTELRRTVATLRTELEALQKHHARAAPSAPTTPSLTTSSQTPYAQTPYAATPHGPTPHGPTPHGSTPHGPTPYAQAIQLAREGGDAVALARDCGISRGEAELIVALHSTRH